MRFLTSLLVSSSVLILIDVTAHADSYPKRVPSMAVLQTYNATDMSSIGSFIVDANGSVWVWNPEETGTPNDQTIVAPDGQTSCTSATPHGCLDLKPDGGAAIPGALYYGADPLGIQDSTAAFVKALLAAPTLIVPAGNYLIDSITLTANQQLLCLPGANITANSNNTGSSGTIEIAGNNTKVDGCTFHLNGKTTSLITVGPNLDNIVITHNSFDGSGSGAYVQFVGDTSYAEDTYDTHVTLSHNRCGSKGSYTGFECFTFQSVKYFTVDDNLIQDDGNSYGMLFRWSHNGSLSNNDVARTVYTGTATATTTGDVTTATFTVPYPVYRAGFTDNGTVVPAASGDYSTSGLGTTTIVERVPRSSDGNTITMRGYPAFNCATFDSGNSNITVNNFTCYGAGDNGIIVQEDWHKTGGVWTHASGTSADVSTNLAFHNIHIEDTLDAGFDWDVQCPSVALDDFFITNYGNESNGSYRSAIRLAWAANLANCRALVGSGTIDNTAGHGLFGTYVTGENQTGTSTPLKQIALGPVDIIDPNGALVPYVFSSASGFPVGSVIFSGRPAKPWPSEPTFIGAGTAGAWLSASYPDPTFDFTYSGGSQHISQDTTHWGGQPSVKLSPVPGDFAQLQIDLTAASGFGMNSVICIDADIDPGANTSSTPLTMVVRFNNAYSQSYTYTGAHQHINKCFAVTSPLAYTSSLTRVSFYVLAGGSDAWVRNVHFSTQTIN